MGAGGWLVDTRDSYDTVAVSYAGVVRELLGRTPFERGMLEGFAGMVHGRVADVGCGSGRVTGFLRGLGIDAYGVDLSPGMVEVARREWPGARFEVGSMTALDIADDALGGLVAWYSLIHVPDDEISGVLAEFRRVLRGGCPLLVGFHVGDGVQVKTEGYGGHPMKVSVYRRQPEQIAGWLGDAGFAVEAQLTLSSAESKAGGVLFAR
jgi:SAM-dependent methyltransferase